MTLNEMRKRVREEQDWEEGFKNLRQTGPKEDKEDEEPNDLTTSLKLLEDSVNIFEDILTDGKKKKNRDRKILKLSHEISAFLSMYINEEV